MEAIKVFEWTTILGAALLFTVLSLLSAHILYEINYPISNPGNANFITIKVEGHQFYWKFIYPNGTTSSVLVIKANQLYRLEITAADVIHSFFIPQLGLKMDAYPNYTTVLWLNVNQPGTYDIFCTEYCGTGHYSMITKLIVVS